MKKETYKDKIEDLEDRIKITLKLLCLHLD